MLEILERITIGQGKDGDLEILEDLSEVMRNGLWFDTVTFPAGTTIVREGDPADCAYIITRGVCEAYRVEVTRRTVLRRMVAGDTFGETAIFTEQSRTASVDAVVDTTATRITREAFERTVGRSWLQPFVRVLAERFQDLDNQLSKHRKAKPPPTPKE